MAKKFKFRLESILKIRTETVIEAKNQLSAVLQLRYAKETEIEALQTSKTIFLSSKHKTTKAADMQTNKDYLLNLNTQIEIKEGEKLEILKLENQKREILNEAIKEEKIILKLKEKKYDEYIKQLNIEETKFIDEIATNKFIKKNKQF